MKLLNKPTYNNIKTISHPYIESLLNPSIN